jgi:CBS-domain-containing membrane protein
MEQDSVKSLMTNQVVSVLPETPILVAIDIILSNNYNGIVVTDKSNVIVGILTKYDLIIKKGYIRDDTKVGDVMNKDPIVLNDSQTIEDAINMFTEHHRVDPIPVIDEQKKVIGIISRYDMVKLFREYGITFDSRHKAGPKKSSVLPLIIIIILAGAAGALYYLGYFNSLLERLY